MRVKSDLHLKFQFFYYFNFIWTHHSYGITKGTKSLEISSRAIKKQICSNVWACTSFSFSHMTWMQYFSLNVYKVRNLKLITDWSKLSLPDQVTSWTCDQMIGGVSLLLWYFILTEKTNAFFFCVFCKNNVNVLSNKTNDSPHVDMVVAFQSKDFVNFALRMPLLSASLHILYWGYCGYSYLLPYIWVKQPARECTTVRRKH